MECTNFNVELQKALESGELFAEGEKPQERNKVCLWCGKGIFPMLTNSRYGAVCPKEAEDHWFVPDYCGACLL